MVTPLVMTHSPICDQRSSFQPSNTMNRWWTHQILDMTFDPGGIVIPRYSSRSIELWGNPFNDENACIWVRLHISTTTWLRSPNGTGGFQLRASSRSESVWNDINVCAYRYTSSNIHSTYGSLSRSLNVSSRSSPMTLSISTWARLMNSGYRVIARKNVEITASALE